MKRKIMTSVFALGLAAIPLTVMLAGGVQGTPTPQLRIMPPLPEQKSLKQPGANLSTSKLVREEGFLYENFENAPGAPSYALPDEWTVTATSGDETDVWKAGTLTLEGEVMPGASGYKYAFILGSQEHEHDAWAFSPGINMVAGKEYTVEFYALFFSGSSGDEKIEVAIGTGQNQQDIREKTYLLEDTDRDNYWVKFSEKFTPSKTATYFVGLHSISAAKGEGTIVDDLKITSGPTPAYSGETNVDFGQTDHLAAPVSCKYDIYNYGSGDLEVNVVSSSPEISAKTASVVIAPEETGSLEFSLDTDTPGEYSGEITLQTNDPTVREIKLSASAQVSESRLTGYDFEDFESGGPEGWELSVGSANTSDYPAKSPTRAFYTTSYYTMINDEGVGFTTHYVQMGENPVFSFWYQLNNTSFFGDDKGPTQSDQPKISVRVSDDFGATYKEVYVIEPGGEHEHIPSSEYAQVVVPLQQYAGKTCRVKLLFSHASGDVTDAMNNTFRVLVDDVATGTVTATDIKASLLTGDVLASPGKEQSYHVTVNNLGKETVEDYSVSLFNAETKEMIATAQGEAIAPNGSKTAMLKWTPASPGSYKLYAVAKAANDVNEANDTTNMAAVAVLPENNSIVHIGNGPVIESQSFPVDFYNVESMAQTIYLANEIGINRGTINSLVFTSSMDAGYVCEPFEVFVGETDKSDFSDKAIVDLSELTPVFSGSVYFPTGKSDFVIPFDTPYEYSGKNLVVMTRKIGKELINSKCFDVRKCDTPRSISKTSNKPGGLESEKPSTANVYADVRVNIEKAPFGSIQGTVKCDGKPVAGADVLLKGSCLHATTDAQGNFALPQVAEGAVALEVTCHGYYDLTTETFDVTNAAVTKDITLTALPRHTVSGKVTSAANGEPVENATVIIEGYDTFSVTTGSDGNYSIDGVCADTGSDYNIRAVSRYFENYGDIISVAGNVQKDISLEDRVLRVHNVTASVNETHTEASVSWEEPMQEFRYDTGIYSGPLGFSGGVTVGFGTVFRKKATIKEVSWYVASGEGDHSYFCIYIFGLNPDGTPNADDVRYVAKDVDFVEDAWSVHTLSEPVNVDGCMVAISCYGFMAIGTTELSPAYPFTEGMHYYAGESFMLGITDMAKFQNKHLMIRAYGDELDDMSAPAADKPSDRIVRPAAKYNIYRMKNGADRSEWTLVGSSDKPAFTDTGIAGLADGRYRYAVTAVYGGGTESMAVMSPVVVVDHSGVENVAAEDNAEAAYYNLQGIRIEHPAKGEVVIVRKGGKTYKTVIR